MPCQFRMSHTEHDTSLSLLDSQITANSCMLWLLSAVCWVCAVRVNPRVYMIILHFFTILLFIHCVLVSFIALFCAHGPKGELRAPRAIYTATHLWFSKQTNTLSTNQRNTGNKAFVALLLLIQINSCCLHCCIHKNRPLWWWALAAEAICVLCCAVLFLSLIWIPLIIRIRAVVPVIVWCRLAIGWLAGVMHIPHFCKNLRKIECAFCLDHRWVSIIIALSL